METNVDKITYTRGTYSREAQKIEFEVPEDLSIQDFKRLCKRLAASLGYSYESIDEVFEHKEPPKSIKQILKD